MTKKLNFFSWKIGPLSETAYQTIEIEVAVTT
jgi:hypothetical protein